MFQMLAKVRMNLLSEITNLFWFFKKKNRSCLTLAFARARARAGEPQSAPLLISLPSPPHTTLFAHHPQVRANSRKWRS